MSGCSPFPEWLSERAVNDDALATAYEACSSAQRGWLKKCISLHFAMSGEAPVRQSFHAEFSRLGLQKSCRLQAVDWCVLLLPHDVVSPVRALAAIVPAMLASVSEVAVVRLGKENESSALLWPAGLLVGLELAGVRRIVDLSLQDAGKLFASLDNPTCCGRILALDGSLHPDTAGKMGLSGNDSRTVRCWSGPRPKIGMVRSLSEPVAESGMTLADVMAWAHPDVTPDVLSSCPSSAEGIIYDALLVSDESVDQCAAAAVLGPGVEGCWLWPDLDRNFFLRRTLYCSSLLPPDSEYGGAL